jgi:hypothetical protein
MIRPRGAVCVFDRVSAGCSVKSAGPLFSGMIAQHNPALTARLMHGVGFPAAGLGVRPREQKLWSVDWRVHAAESRPLVAQSGFPAQGPRA